MRCMQSYFLKNVGLLLACILAISVQSAEKETAEMKEADGIRPTGKSDDVKARLKAVPNVHPRLFLRAEDEEKLNARVTGDPLLKSALDHVSALSDAILPLPVLERVQVGRRLLDVSRTALRRILYLSFAYRMTKDRRYLERARKEMLACANFKDWNPSHFLDVAEMTAALAIGYDWL